MSSRRALAANAVLALGSTFVALVAAEVAVRVVADRLPPAALVHLHPELKAAIPRVMKRITSFNPWLHRREEDPDLGWRFQRSFLFSGTNEDGEDYALRTSPTGFMTPDEPDPSELQVVSIGDSFMSTPTVGQPTPWALRERIGIPLYNLAVGGWGPDNYLAAFRKLGAGRSAPVVVVFSFINDITDVDNWSRWKASGTSLPFSSWLWNDVPDRGGANFVNLDDGWLDRHSVLWNVAKLGLGTLRGAGADPAGKASPRTLEVESIPGEREGDSFELSLVRGYPFQTLDPADFEPGGSYRRYLDAYFERLLELRDDVTRSGARLLLVWIPTKERVYLPVLAPDRKARYVSNRSGEIDGLERAISDFASRNEIPFLDLTADLERRAKRGERLYFRLDGHMTDHGNRVAGQLAGDFVRRFLPARPQPPPEPGADTSGVESSGHSMFPSTRTSFSVSSSAHPPR